MLRAVVDTCVWVSSVLNPAGAPRRVRSAVEQGRFILIASEPLLDELARVLARPRLARFGVTPADAAELLAFLRYTAELVPVTGAVHLCRDPTDDMLIETALCGNADFLVSRDEDLTRSPELTATLASLGVRPLTVRQFLAELGDGE